MSIVIKEIQVHTTVEKEYLPRQEVTQTMLEKMKQELKKELQKMIRKEINLTHNKER